jgi:hypothetical protein
VKQPVSRFVKCAGAATLVFLVLVLFVFREIQHTRELYQLSRLVMAAEAERRLWQEKLRLAEGRSASLVAAMHSQQALSPNTLAMNAAYVVPARWR